MIYLGILINPKTKGPVHAMYDSGKVKIYAYLSGTLQKVGQGYYDYERLGCPRTHTPGGVNPKGKGFGTMLYCALAVGSMYEEGLDFDDACVHSLPGDRSSSAESWWSAAVDMSLAEDEEVEDIVSFEDEDWSDYIDSYWLSEIQEDVHSIDDYSLRVSGERGGDREINVLRVETIAQHGLIGLLPDMSRGNQTVVTDEDAFLRKGYVEVDDYNGDEFGNIEFPTDEEEAAPLLAMDTDGLPRDFLNYLRRVLVDHADVPPEKVAAAGYARPTDPERYGGKQLELIANPAPTRTARQVRRIWESISDLPDVDDDRLRNNPLPKPYPFLSLAKVKKYESQAQARGVSKVARSARGFLTAYKKAGSAGNLTDHWHRKRHAFIARHMAQVKGRREPLWETVHGKKRPTRRHLALIMWGYSPEARKL